MKAFRVTSANGLVIIVVARTFYRARACLLRQELATVGCKEPIELEMLGTALQAVDEDAPWCNLELRDDACA
jgi:hypothetical protein